ncbi:Gfo/Idh/MocA family protein [Streptomyces sp. NPDC055060]
MAQDPSARHDGIRVGLLGCADIARRRVLPAMAATEGIRIAAIASRDADRAEELARPYGAEPVHGYQRLLDRDDIDAVYLPLPAALHAEWTEAALRAGKHVLAEKPLTTDLETSRRLVALARESGRFMMENVMFVHHPLHDAVLKLVADGAIGELRAFQAAFAIPRLPDDDIRHRADLGGGALWDTGVYPVRAALRFLGDGLEVRGALLGRGPGREVDTSGQALLSTPGGIGARLVFGLDHAYRSSYELWGSEGRITVERAFTPPADFVPEVRVERRSGTEVVRLPPADQVALTVAAFVKGVRARSTPDPVCLRQAELLDGIRGAAGERN